MGWNAGSVLLTQGLGILRAIILARLLTPNDYGLFGMAAAVLGAVNALTNLGFDTSVIVRQFRDYDETVSNLDTVWTLELGRRLTLTLLLWAATYPTVLFYNDARLYAILPVVALVPFIQGFQNIGLVLFRKQVAFKRIVIYEQLSGISATIVAVALALITRNVWALVLSQVASALVSVALSYWLHPYRPHLAFDRVVFRNSIAFGRNMFVVGLMTYITTTADNLMLGRLAGAVILGAYVFAYNLASIPVGMVMGSVSNVLYPAYAELKSKSANELRDVLDRVFLLSSSVLLISALVFFLLSNEIILVLFGPQWSASVPLLRILAWIGLTRGLVHVLAPLAIAFERPELEARAKTAEAILFVALLYPLIRLAGAVGAAWAGVIVYSVTLVVRWAIVMWLAPGSAVDIPRLSLLSLAVAACTCVITTLALRLVDDSIWRLVIGGLITVSVTAVGLLAVHPLLRHEAYAWFATVRGIPLPTDARGS
jgi:lipopolysaccharide exporter